MLKEIKRYDYVSVVRFHLRLSTSKNCVMYSQSAVSDDTLQKSFEKFKCRNFSLKDMLTVEDHL